jgi:hypothetical protein
MVYQDQTSYSGNFNVTEDAIDRAPTKLDNKAATDKLRDTRLTWDVRDAWALRPPKRKAFMYRANTSEQVIKSRLDRIYIANRLMMFTFGWVIAPSPVPTDHWLVAIRYAPKDAPEIGKGRWTLPLHLLQQKDFMEQVATRELRLQAKLENVNHHTPEEGTDSPQMLWERFKEAVQEIAKQLLAETHYKINSRIMRLEKDRAELANALDADNNNDTRTSEAIIACEMSCLEEK